MVQTVTESMLRWLQRGRNQVMVEDSLHGLTGEWMCSKDSMGVQL